MRGKRGFTLAELLVAASLLSIVMAAVYAALGSTIRVWRNGESETNQYQDGRIALNLLSRELGCVLGQTEHLFSGENDEFEFYAVTPSLDVEKGEAARVMWVRYYYSNRKLYRQEAVVESPLPNAGEAAQDQEKALGRIKLGRKRRFEIASNVRDFEVEYVWVPLDQERGRDAPPRWMDPIMLTRHEKGWGLPQAVRVKLSLRQPDSKRGTTDFTLAKAFPYGSGIYNEKTMLNADGGGGE